MSKKFIKFLIILMSISLIGVIAVQILWIRNAINIQEKNFQSNVNKSLHKIVSRLEENEAVILLNDELQANPHLKFGDFDFHEINRFIDKDEDLKKHHIEISTHANIKKDSLHIIQTDSHVIVTGKAKNKIKIWQPKQTIDSLINIDIQVINKDTVLRTIRKEKQLENIFEKVVYEFKSKNLTLSDRIDLKKLPAIIHEELKNYNVDTEFNFAILSKPPKDASYLSPDADLQVLIESPYQINLFPNDIITRNQRLSLDFPNRYQFVYRSIFPLLILSTIFSLFIVLTFTSAVFLILKQKRINDIKSDFINNITHEFKTPIATIALAADSINNPKVIGLPDRIRYFTGMIKDENFRMNKQVENILQLSLLGKQEMQLNLQTYHVNEILQKAIDHIQLQIDEKDGKLEFQPHAINDLCQIDEVHFLNVLFNLFDNAIKYSKSELVIEVGTHNQNQNIFITIKDYGIGMSPSTLKKAFQKFYRAESGNIHRIKGFGLGLSYVKLVIEQHFGHIKIESKLGESTTITIQLPLKEIS